MNRDAEVATDAPVAFLTLERKTASGEVQRTEYQAKALGLRDFIELQTWMRQNVVREAMKLIAETGADDVAQKLILGRALDESGKINIIEFDNPETQRALLDVATVGRIVYLSLRRAHPDISVDTALDVFDAAPDLQKLVDDIMSASMPDLTDDQKKGLAAGTPPENPETVTGILPGSENSTGR